MSIFHNPYATALDGLELPDPVAAFFRFCKERESIRILRENGAPPPWSKDPIFQRGRFLNVFREDDRGSKAILRFAAPVADDLPMLIHSLFFARWCNRQSTLDILSTELLENPATLQNILETLPSPPWCNITAYPVEPIRWESTLYSRFDTAISLFGRIKMQLTDAILSAERDVIQGTNAVNAILGMKNDFPIFMAIMDLAWFRPDVMNPSSHVPTGIGAVAYLDRLQKHLGLDNHRQCCEKMIALQEEYWPEAKRSFQPIDIEYLSCECRKYYSYVNGTKHFEGKNRFTAGKSAQLLFDIPDEATPKTKIQTQIHVIAGGPCSGKTTLLNALKESGYQVEEERAEQLLKAGIAEGRTAKEIRVNPVQWQQKLLYEDHALFEGLPIDRLVFTDTSFLETLVFGARAGIAVGPNTELWLSYRRYKAVFFLEPLTGYQQSDIRIESQELAIQISKQIRAAYAQYGYEVIPVPSTSIAERMTFIQSFLSE